MLNKKINEIETDEEFAEFSTILTKIKNSHAVATIKQATIKPDGNYAYMDLQQAVAKTRTLVQIDGGYLYITLQNIRRVDVKKIKNYWEMVLQRGTVNFAKGKENDYLFAFDIIKEELQAGFVYNLSAMQPIFASSDGDDDLKFVFPLQNAWCGTNEVSIYDIEYEEAMRDENENNIYDESNYDDEDFDYDEEAEEENEEIIGNDEYL